MLKPIILQPGQSYTFRQYFEMSYEPEDILAEFSCPLKRQILSLPHQLKKPSLHLEWALPLSP
jgi:hypothetical protein